jgi:hypothetical protein
MTRTNALVAAFIGMTLISATAHAAVVIEHLGDADPAAVGFDFNTFLGGTGAQGPGFDTEPYWFIQRGPEAAGRFIADLSIIPGGLEALADPTGWTATARMKLVAGGDFTFQSWFSVDDSSDLWSMHLIDGTGDQAAGVYGVQNTSSGLGFQLSTVNPTLDYHTYQIVYDPADDDVTYYVDGINVGNQTRATAPFQGVLRLEFGDSERGPATDSRWSLVRFETGQHPIDAINIPGDYNNDGSVDAADYTVWRDNPDGFGGTEGYDTWKSHFGEPGGSGSLGVSTAVPEPSATILLGAVVMGMLSKRGRRNVSA